MSYPLIARRSLLIGGASLALVGCGPTSGGGGTGGGSTSAGEELSSYLPAWADIPIYLKMATVAGSVGGMLAGAVGMPGLAVFCETISALAGRGETIYNFIEMFNDNRATRFAPPTQGSSPRPFVAPKNNDTNDFGFVPVFKNDVTLQFGVVNQDGGNFGNNDIYATVKRADEPAPRTLAEVFGTGDLPHAIVTPASGGNYDGTLPIGVLPSGAYVSYSWTVPHGQQPTDDYIAANAFIGPAFLAVADADNSIDLGAALEPGRNVVAQFQLPNAVAG